MITLWTEFLVRTGPAGTIQTCVGLKRGQILTTTLHTNNVAIDCSVISTRHTCWPAGAILEVGMDAAYQSRAKRERYSPEVMKALTISAARKSPPNWLSLFNQN